jgi:hypothetical protein
VFFVQSSSPGGQVRVHVSRYACSVALHQFYSRRAPEKTVTVDAMLDMYAQREHTLLQILAHRYNIPVHTLEELLPTEQMEQEQYHKQKHKHNEYQKRIRQQKEKDEEEEEEEEEFKKGLGLGLEKDARTQLNDLRKQKGSTPMDLRSQLQELEQRQQEMSTSFKKKNQKKKDVNAHNNQIDDHFMSTEQSASDKTKSSGPNVSSGTPLNNAHKRVRRKTFAMVTSKLQSPTNSTNTSEKNIKRKKSAQVHKKQAEDLSRLLQTDISRSSLSEMSIQEADEEEEEEESESDKDEDEEEKKNHAYTVSGELRELENEFTLKEEEHGSSGASGGLSLRRSSFLQKVSNLKKNDKETF